MRPAAFALLAALAWAGAEAQERPSEEELFGGDGPEETGTRSPQPRLPAGDAAQETARDEEALGGLGGRTAFERGDLLEDPLKIGGQFYLRAVSQGRQGVSPADTAFSFPLLVDGYFDARPSDRLRGMVVARMTFDPTLAPSSPGVSTGAIPGAGPTGLGTGTSASENPGVLLDQAWLRFDVLRTVFVTAGKQHVKWGTARFWNPTDFLTPARRDPLATFDARTGASMLKLHVPWEARGWNFYGIGLFDNAGPASTLRQLGGALRAEVVLGPAELGAGAVYQGGRKPRYGVDLSSALGPFDVYGELALKRSADRPIARLAPGSSLDDLASGELRLEETFPEDPLPQATGGLTYTFAYSDTDTATVGVEYFYNTAGYDNALVYPYLIFRGLFQPFYMGRHYGALYALLNAPGSWEDTSFILSSLGNFSDRSFISRLDVLHQALSYLAVEAQVSVSHGRNGGEFRFAVDVPEGVIVNGEPAPRLFLPAPTVQVGLGLRINI